MNSNYHGDLCALQAKAEQAEEALEKAQKALDQCKDAVQASEIHLQKLRTLQAQHEEELDRQRERFHRLDSQVSFCRGKIEGVGKMAEVLEKNETESDESTARETDTEAGSEEEDVSEEDMEADV